MALSDNDAAIAAHHRAKDPQSTQPNGSHHRKITWKLLTLRAIAAIVNPLRTTTNPSQSAGGANYDDIGGSSVLF